MNLEQQREYVDTLTEMWLKTHRVCGSSSNPTMAMLVVLTEEIAKLQEMEEDNVSS